MIAGISSGAETLKNISPADKAVSQACDISSFKFLRLNPIQMYQIEYL
jgi:hypothetical protein